MLDTIISYVTDYLHRAGTGLLVEQVGDRWSNIWAVEMKSKKKCNDQELIQPNPHIPSSKPKAKEAHIHINKHPRKTRIVNRMKRFIQIRCHSATLIETAVTSIFAGFLFLITKQN